MIPHHLPRRRPHQAGVAILTAALTTALALAGVLTTVTPAVGAPAPGIDAETSAALARYAGVAADDDSSTTACIGGPAPQHVAYRTDGIMLRVTPGASFLADVQQAAQPLGVTVHPQTEILQVPGDTADIVHVPLSTGNSEPVPVVRLVRELRRDGIVASPNYLYSQSPSYLMFPDDGPRNTTLAPPARTPATLGAGVTVQVYDTGLPPPTEATTVPNVTRLAAGDVETVDAELPSGVVDRYYSGHSVGISSIVHSLAPGATITLARITDTTNTPSDLSTLRRMVTTLKKANQAGTWPELIVTPFGTAACDVKPAAPGAGNPADQLVPLGLDSVVRATDAKNAGLIVASAGNRGTDRRFYPAGFDSVLAVGALDTTSDLDLDPFTSPTSTGTRAGFSNYGSWVDVWAPGRDLVMSSLKGFAYTTNGQTVNGTVLWSGTSFSAPYIAALLAEVLGAARSAGRTVTAETLWEKELRPSGRTCSGSSGSGVAVTLPALGSPATASRSGLAVSC